MNTSDVFYCLIENIAIELKAPWRFNYRIDKNSKNENLEILGENGSIIIFHRSAEYSPTIHVSGFYPQKKNSNRFTCVRDWGVIKRTEKTPRIKFSMNRSVKSLTNDLKRRFIDSYLHYYDLCLKAKSETEQEVEFIGFQVSAMQRVCKLRRVSNYDPKSPKLTLPVRHYTEINGSVSLNYRKKFNLELQNLSLEKTIQLLAIINDN